MTTLLSVKNISVTLGNRKILDNVSLDMEAGGLKVLIGPSGAGKVRFYNASIILSFPMKAKFISKAKKSILKTMRNFAVYAKMSA